jgi:hypothetical protein
MRTVTKQADQRMITVPCTARNAQKTHLIHYKQLESHAISFCVMAYDHLNLEFIK